MILASQSPRRVQLMDEAGYRFDAVPADVDETPLHGEQPVELALRLAKLKALAIAETRRGSGEIVIGADTVVIAPERPEDPHARALGKPKDADEARFMLQELSGATHQVATGVCIARAEDDPHVLDAFSSVTDVRFYSLSPAAIEAYVESGEPLDKAGAYGIQGKGRMLVQGIDGDFYNVVGLPIAELARRLSALGIEPERAL